jgi:hypothetical protein
VHVAGVSTVEPLAEEAELDVVRGRRNPAQVEAGGGASRLTSADEIEAAIIQVLRPPAMAACYCRSS